jgi:CheY-like chemotaxis protein
MGEPDRVGIHATLIGRIGSVGHPEVGIIDVDLPNMDGYRLAKRIRSDSHGRTMLLVALTNGSVGPEVWSADAFDHRLVRPVDFDFLGRLIGRGAGG